MNRLSVVCGLYLVFAVAAPSAAGIVTTFSDGTLSGWTAYGGSTSLNPGPFGGILQTTAAGNPDFAMEAIDTVSGGGGLFAIGPAQFTGDLSVYVAVSWDEFVLDLGPTNTLFSTGIYIGSEGSVYRTDESPGVRGAWNHRFARFAESRWFHDRGTKTFDEVVSNVTHFWVQMDVSTAGGAFESRVDNIRLHAQPEPATLILAVMAMLLAAPRQLRRAHF